MAPTTWTMPEEAAFLQSKTSSYSEAQKDGNFIAFWATLYEQWEEKFSTFDKLFGNRDPADLTADEQATFASALKAKRQPLVEPQLDSSLTHGSLLAARNQIIKQLWEAKTNPDVKAQVEAHFGELKPSAEATPSQQSSDKYAHAIRETPTFLNRVLDGFAKKTGWYYTVLMGGPNPADNGNINVASLHVGENSNGASFGQAQTNFECHYMEPYAQFLTAAFSPVARALLGRHFRNQALTRRTPFQEDSRPFWDQMVNDVARCLQQMIASPPVKRKRVAGADKENSQKRARKA
ncbi:hypothetical protein H0H92_014715 [Tricholoma furcatifolium]|nr:hypothetical protein H0H92_014715 [Tricholoma furcatifolium]